jgi:hypothetical protein
MADKEETEKTIAEDLVVTKYKMAGEIVNRKKMPFYVHAKACETVKTRSARVFFTLQPYGIRRANAGLFRDHVLDSCSGIPYQRYRSDSAISIIICKFGCACGKH